MNPVTTNPLRLKIADAAPRPSMTQGVPHEPIHAGSTVSDRPSAR
jgi:hypothetical protein